MGYEMVMPTEYTDMTQEEMLYDGAGFSWKNVALIATGVLIAGLGIGLMTFGPGVLGVGLMIGGTAMAGAGITRMVERTFVREFTRRQLIVSGRGNLCFPEVRVRRRQAHPASPRPSPVNIMMICGNGRKQITDPTGDGRPACGIFGVGPVSDMDDRGLYRGALRHLIGRVRNPAMLYSSYSSIPALLSLLCILFSYLLLGRLFSR